jgi:hypothetical protein
VGAAAALEDVAALAAGELDVLAGAELEELEEEELHPAAARPRKAKPATASRARVDR